MAYGLACNEQVNAFVPELLEIHGAPGLDEWHDTAHSLRAVETDSRFRGYADCMQTLTFRENLDHCIELAKQDVSC